MAYIRRRGCKCKKELDADGKPKKKKCTCGAKWSYTLDIGIDPTTGKRKQKTESGFNTKEAATLAAAEVLKSFKGGTYVDGGKELFQKCAKEWMEHYKNSGRVKEGTIYLRQYAVDKWIDAWPYFMLKDIETYHYEDALQRFKNEGLSKSTLVAIHTAGRMIFNYAVERKKIAINPTASAKLPLYVGTVEDLENDQAKVKYLEKIELKKFLEAAKAESPTDHFIFFVLAYTGMRVGELGALKWKDLDPEAGTLRIRKTLYSRGDAKTITLLTPKTIKSIRDIPIEEEVFVEFEKHRSHQKQLMMKYRKTYYDDGFITVRETARFAGYPMKDADILRRMKVILKRANLNEDLTPHSLRHTHASLLAEAGVGLEEIMERLGHEDDKTTKTIYLHITKSRKRTASKKFSELMKSV
ncbi:tyrosine-type recombinase/integrase [Cohnella sp. GCM10020058]|uniref:site-specific integrase n=1 Tax=Cohnella sp. GCM10020058 TaxID=3317330 RepID=UPI00362B1EAD